MTKPQDFSKKITIVVGKGCIQDDKYIDYLGVGIFGDKGVLKGLIKHSSSE